METIKIETIVVIDNIKLSNLGGTIILSQRDNGIAMDVSEALQLASAINEAFGEWLDVDDNTPTDEYLFALIGGKVYIKYIDSANKMWYNYTDDYTYTTNTKWQPITKPRQ